MDKEALKERVSRTIDDNADRLIALAKELQQHPEVGFQERETAGIVARELRALGLTCEEKLVGTGVRAVAPGREHDFRLCIMSELDALDLPQHCKANPLTGAAHGCGHHAQMTMMLGSAIGLIESGVSRELDGDIQFFAVPAEELVQLDKRRKMREQGELYFVGGKAECIRRGYFDDIDLFLMMHSQGREDRNCRINTIWNGTAVKTVRFLGKSAHAGLCPEKGINALHAATAAITCINLLRETFRDEDHVRVHYILTKGGTQSNIVLEEVEMELLVRASTFEAMADANFKVKRAIRGAAAAMGAEVEMDELGGYMPYYPNEQLEQLVGENAASLLGPDALSQERSYIGCSTDAGDVSMLKPIAQPMLSGFRGDLHTTIFDATDDYMAYVVPAKVNALAAVDLLYGHAKQGREICADYRPKFQSKEEYVAAWEKFFEL